MHKTLAITLLVLSTFAFTLGFPREAGAQGSNKAAAEALYQQGVDLFNAKKYAEAVEKLSASQQLDPAIGTLLYMGDGYEKLNRKASAWAAFKEAASLAQSQKDEREKTAEIRAAALLPQVSHLVVRIRDEHRELAGFVVRRNGVELPAASLGVPLPIDAGVVKIEATADGRAPWSKNVTVPDGGKEISVDVPTLTPVYAQPAPGPVAPPAQTPLPNPAPDDVDEDNTGTALLLAGVTVGIIGLAGVAVGAVFGVQARDSRDESLGKCRTEVFCTPEGVTLRNEALDQATISTITFIVGGVLVAGGVTLVVLSQTLESDDAAAGGLRHLEVAPASAGAEVGLSLRGAW